MKSFIYSDLATQLISTAKKAGRAQLKIYATDFEVDFKADNSPVSKADLLSEQIILEDLARLAPDIPVLAEEEASEGNIPTLGHCFFCVDPLDGTKEFINRNDEFTINIALIENHRPVFGLIYAPALSQLYLTIASDKAVQVTMVPDEPDKPLDEISFTPLAPRKQQDNRPLIAVASRSHMNDNTRHALQQLNINHCKKAGSSLKFCLVAAGEADLYPRFGPTMEWDTAAGHALVLATGGEVITTDGMPLMYGKNTDTDTDTGSGTGSGRAFLNPDFIALADRHSLAVKELVTAPVNNLSWEILRVDKKSRADMKKQMPFIVWFSGLSGSGKSAIASLLEQRLHDQHKHTYMLDGDNIRHGLCADLSFAVADRNESLRRVAETGKLLLDAGLIVIVATISPLRSQRKMVRNLFESHELVEVFVDASLETCESRDVKGLYKKAREGTILEFTGISSPYERPENPDIILATDHHDVEKMTQRLWQHLEQRNLLQKG